MVVHDSDYNDLLLRRGGFCHYGKFALVTTHITKDDDLNELLLELHAFHWFASIWITILTSNKLLSSLVMQYHLGSSMDRTYPDGRKIHLSLLANPCE